MAIYSLHHSPIGKSTQAEPYTASAHIGYITRKKALSALHQARFPGRSAQAVADYLRACEDHDRKNARVLDKVMLALPKELSKDQQVRLVRDFAEDVTKARAPWLAAFHTKGKDAHNPHCHLVIRDRDPNTGKRVIGTSEIGSTERLRESWERFANRALERAGHSERIDRRTLAEQGIAREPTIHEGPQSQAMDRRRVRPRSRLRRLRNRPGSRRSHRNVDYRNIDGGQSRPEYNRGQCGARESERDYWDAIDQDQRREELGKLAAIHNPHSVHGIGGLPAGRVKDEPERLAPRLLPFKSALFVPGGSARIDLGKPALKPTPDGIAGGERKDERADMLGPRQPTPATRGRRIGSVVHSGSVRSPNNIGKGHSVSDDEELSKRKKDDLTEAQQKADKNKAHYDNLMRRSYLNPKAAGARMKEHLAKKGEQDLHDKLSNNSRGIAFGRRPGSIASADGYRPGAAERRQDSQIARQSLPDAERDNRRSQDELAAAKGAMGPGAGGGSASPAQGHSRSYLGSTGPDAKRDERALDNLKKGREADKKKGL